MTNSSMKMLTGSDPLGPDELIEQKMLWPDTRVIPFHYPHPVTGKPVAEDDLRAPHYGQDVGTAAPPLSLSLPKDQQEKLQASGEQDISGVSFKSNGVKPISINGDSQEVQKEMEKVEIAA
jgi:hypothetical protein